eukprot:363413-Chlamydomonas_euryale.AAC.1
MSTGRIGRLTESCARQTNAPPAPDTVRLRLDKVSECKGQQRQSLQYEQRAKLRLDCHMRGFVRNISSARFHPLNSLLCLLSTHSTTMHVRLIPPCMDAVMRACMQPFTHGQRVCMELSRVLNRWRLKVLRHGRLNPLGLCLAEFVKAVVYSIVRYVDVYQVGCSALQCLNTAPKRFP